MSTCEIRDKNGKFLDLVTVRLALGQPQAPYDKKAPAVPCDGGYQVFMREVSRTAVSRAARALAGLGVWRIDLRSQYQVNLDPELCLAFMNALYDGRHDLVVRLPLDTGEIKTLMESFDIVCACREFADQDAKAVTPVELGTRAALMVAEAARRCGGVSDARIIKRGDAGFSGYAGLTAVGMGSEADPCLAVITYASDSRGLMQAPAVALAGKGITFDSGGYDIKPDKSMDTMRTDKTAAVNLTGALCLAIARGLKRPVRLYLACAENMVSGKAMLPGDIVRYSNGTTVEITNTDAEGRVVLADALLAAWQDRAERIIDCATLTGAAKIALGRERFAVFTRDNVMPEALRVSFDRTGEQYWQLPFSEDYLAALDSRRADLTNSQPAGGGSPGASVGAAFLSKFVEASTPWVHIDLSSAYLPSGSKYLAAGPTGAGIRGLADYLVTGI